MAQGSANPWVPPNPAQHKVPAAPGGEPPCAASSRQGKLTPLQCHTPSSSIPCTKHKSNTAPRRASLEHSWQTTALGAPKGSVLCLSYQETVLKEYCCLWQSITSVCFLLVCQKKPQNNTLILVKNSFLNSENCTKGSTLHIDGT